MQQEGADIFPKDVDVVTGGFPCQDFSVAGKRKGFDSDKDDYGKKRDSDEPSEATRGKLYFWMKQVVDIVKPKIFVAENVKGLVNLGDVKDIIQKDFASADGNGYIVLPPKVLHAGNYGVPETRERVIFIGIRKMHYAKRLLSHWNLHLFRQIMIHILSLLMLPRLQTTACYLSLRRLMY